MGNNTNPSYVFLKGNTYYFNRHIPKDIRSYYKSNRVIICLKTKRRFEALRAAKSIAQRLEDYWLSLRISNIDIPGLHLIRNNLQATTNSSCIKLSEALEVYLKLKGFNKDKTFYRGAKRNTTSLVSFITLSTSDKRGKITRYLLSLLNSLIIEVVFPLPQGKSFIVIC